MRAASAQPKMMFGFSGNKFVSGRLCCKTIFTATPRREAPQSTRAWIERVAQAVADQVEGENSKKNCKPRPNRHPGRIDEETLGGVEHATPRRRGRLLTKAQKRQRRFGDDGGGDRECRLHQQRGQDI